MTPEQDGLLRMAEESLAAARLLHAQSMHRFALTSTSRIRVSRSREPRSLSRPLARGWGCEPRMDTN